MKIVVDDKIPYICEKLAFLADDVVYLKGSEISNEDVKNADALIVRTRTRCDKHLLEGRCSLLLQQRSVSTILTRSLCVKQVFIGLIAQGVMLRP